MRIIGIWAPAPQSGKSTIAKHLVQTEGFANVPFAGTLKRMLGVLLSDLGYDPDEISKLMHSDKSAPLRPDLPVTLRYACQSLGTEWGRHLIHDGLWLKTWAARVAMMRKMPGLRGIVVDDVRFQNEVDAIRVEGGEVWAVIRPGTTSMSHVSEALNIKDVRPTRTFINDQGIENLLLQLQKETS
jgi:hypothetical protein